MPAKSVEGTPTVWSRAARWVLRRWVPVLLTVIALVVMGGNVAGHSRAMSPIDEWVYLDYLQKVPTQVMVHKGEPLTQEALGYMACDGQAFQGIIPGLTCSPPYERHDFPYAGLTTAATYTPLYFVPTSLLGYAIHFVTGIDIVAAWRFANAGWLVAGVLMLLALLRRFTVPPLAQFAVGLLVIGAPFSYLTYSYVSTDAPALFFSALLLYLTVRLIRGEVPGWTLLVAGVLAVAAKVTLSMAVFMVLVILVVEWIIRGRERAPTGEPLGRRLFAWSAVRLPVWGLLTLAAGAAFEWGWLKLVEATAVSSDIIDQGVSEALTVVELARQSVGFVFGVLRYSYPVHGPWGFDAVPVPSFASMPLLWLAIAGIVASFLMLTKKSDNRSLVIGTAIAAVTVGPLLALLIRFSTGAYFTLVDRYAAFMIPALVLFVALILRNRWATWLLIIYGAGLALAQPVASFLVTAQSG